MKSNSERDKTTFLRNCVLLLLNRLLRKRREKEKYFQALVWLKSTTEKKRYVAVDIDQIDKKTIAIGMYVGKIVKSQKMTINNQMKTKETVLIN